MSSAVAGALARRSISAPFPVQRLVLGDVLAGRDVLVESPTGSGKTLAFGIPLVERIESGADRPAALVLAPTRELASQITKELEDVARVRRLRISAVYGGVGLAEQARRAAQSQIVVATPGRLEDLLQREALALGGVRMLVLDEADRMLDLGFRPAIDRIVGACPERRQTLFFSATLDGIVGSLAARYTRRSVTHRLGTRGRHATARVEHRFVPVRGNGRVQTLVRELEGDRDRALVFVRTKRGADRLVKRLGDRGVDALAIHGDKSQGQRERALARFHSGAVDTLVATDVAARGIDVNGVSHVINFDPPHDRDAYIHRIGRTGRAGRRGVGITLVAAQQKEEIRELAGRLGLRREFGNAGGHDGGDGHSSVTGRRRSRRRNARSGHGWTNGRQTRHPA